MTYVTLIFCCDLKSRKTSLRLLHNTLRSTENRKQKTQKRAPASCCLLTLCGEAQKGLKNMGDGCYKNKPLIPKKSHFHGNVYREAQLLTAANSSKNYYPPWIYYGCFHLPVSYFLFFFFFETGGHINICSWCSQSNAVPQ